MIGASFNNICYSSYNEAASAYFQSIAPIQTATSTYHYEFFWGVWTRFETTGNSIVSFAAPLPNFPSCDTMAAFNDGLIFGSAMASFLICVSLFGMLSKTAS